MTGNQGCFRPRKKVLKMRWVRPTSKPKAKR